MEVKMIGLILLNIALILVILAIELPKLKEKKCSKCTVEKPEMSEEDKKQYEKTRKAFNSLMNYDEKQALKRGEVDGD